MNQCISTCPDGFYGTLINYSSNICTACDLGCATCASTSNNCFSCRLSYYKDLNYNICSKTCPDGQYIDDVNSPNVCVLCNATCATCNNLACLACNIGFNFDSKRIRCISDCQIGEYKDPNNNQCTPCDNSCLLCSINDPKTCYSCSQGYYLEIGTSSCQTHCDRYAN